MTREQLIANRKNYLGRITTLFEKLAEFERKEERGAGGHEDAIADATEFAFAAMELFDRAACDELGDLFKNLYNAASGA